MSAKPSFGFEGLSDIQPAAPSGQKQLVREIDKVGERLGFQSREAAVRRRKRQTSDEPTDQLNLRAAIVDINRIVEWCEENRYSYREGFSKLVTLIDKA